LDYVAAKRESKINLRQVDGFSPGTPFSSTIKTDRHDITEILLRVALNTITPIQHNATFKYEHVSYI
jgi:hypothetical protein